MRDGVDLLRSFMPRSGDCHWKRKLPKAHFPVAKFARPLLIDRPRCTPHATSIATPRTVRSPQLIVWLRPAAAAARIGTALALGRGAGTIAGSCAGFGFR